MTKFFNQIQEKAISTKAKFLGAFVVLIFLNPNTTPSVHPPRCTLSAEAILFDRVDTAKNTLVERVPGATYFLNIPATPGAPALNSTNLKQGFAPRFRLSAAYHVDSKWDYSTKLYNAELNMQKKFSNVITMLAGFQWLQLHENLQGTIPPPDRIKPTWKMYPKADLAYIA